MNPLAKAGLAARRGFGRIVPDPFAIAVVATVVVMVAAMIAGRAPVAMLEDWGGRAGLWRLLEFTLQMCTMLVLGTALANAPAIERGLTRVVSLASGPRSLVALTAALAGVMAVMSWSLGLIGGAVVAREAGRRARDRGIKVHYPLLCAAGYSGLMVWHGGLSGSAPLKATHLADMVEVLGPALAARVGVIDLHDTLLGSLNLWVTGGLLVLGPVVFALMCPAAGDDPNPLGCPDRVAGVRSDSERAAVPPSRLERFEQSGLISVALGVLLVLALAVQLRRGVGQVDIDQVNLALFGLALLVHGSPTRFLRACEDGARGCVGVLVQFPLYGGVMGVLGGAGLVAALAAAMTGLSATAFVVVTFLQAGFLNLLVPSGGGQWALQAPIVMDAALRLGVAPADALMAVAYGDEWTNMLQPFWALPLLALTGVRARDIIGYTAVWMGIGGAFVVVVLVAAT